MTCLEAGFALNIISSPVNGLMPLRALVAGFFLTIILAMPGMVKVPCFLRLAPTMPCMHSKTFATSFLEISTVSAIVAKSSLFVGGLVPALNLGAAFFFAAAFLETFFLVTFFFDTFFLAAFFFVAFFLAMLRSLRRYSGLFLCVRDKVRIQNTEKTVLFA